MKFEKYIILLLFVCSCNKNINKIDMISDQIISEYAKEMEKKGLYVVGFGGGEKNGKINLFDVCFDVNQLLTIDTAREYIVNSTINLMNFINKDEKNEFFFEKFPVLNNIIHITIIGEEVEDFGLNNIQSVSLVSGKIFYKIRNKKTNATLLPPLIWVHEETFEEAQRILTQADRDRAHTIRTNF